MIKPFFKSSVVMLAMILFTGFGAPEHSSLEKTIEQTDSSLVFNFRIKMKDGIMVNDEGPWQLDVQNHEHLDFEKTSFTTSDLNQSLPAFEFSTRSLPSADSGEISYRLIAFICTEDKARCYRETHNGTLAWNKK